jgi:hypothetical protein
MTSIPTSDDAESEPESGFNAGTLPEPAGDLQVPSAPSGGVHALLRGRGVTREKPAEEPKAEEPTPEPELVAVTADGQNYEPKETKNVSEHPLHQIRVEVDKNGDMVLADGPQFVDQFTNPAFAKTVIPGPFEARVCDLSDAVSLGEYNKLLAQREPMGAPRVQILEQERQFDPTCGNWKVFLMFRRISYRKVVT